MRNFDIVGRRKLWYFLSLCVIIPGIVSMFVKGFNFGIDFTGGTLIELRFDEKVSIGAVREVMKGYDLDNSMIQLSGDASNATEARDVMIRTVDLEENDRKAVMASLKEKLGAYSVLREEKVGATMGAELLMNAALATLLSWLLIVAYVSFRFEFRFGIAAVLALIHDVLVVLGVFSILQKQVDSSFVAALLTIVGYSINDTIVIFDRIRENAKKMPTAPREEVTNISIRESLGRTICTTVTTLITIVALCILGVASIREFALPIIVGILSGVYSANMINGYVWAFLEEKRRSRKAKA